MVKSGTLVASAPASPPFTLCRASDGVEALKGAVPAGHMTSLRPLSDADYRLLVSRVCDVYASAIPDLTLPEPLVPALAKLAGGLVAGGYVLNPRQAMKFVIEFLDVVRYHPQSVGPVVRDLQSRLAF